MRAFLALMRREYLEHRGAFLYGPALLLAVFVVALGLSLFSGSGRLELFGVMRLDSSQKLYEGAYLLLAAGWWYYLLLTLFFYFADSFNADSRNNSMLFWKSMPQGDFKMLVSKAASGMTLFPALVFVALVITGGLLIAAAYGASAAIPSLPEPDVATLVESWIEIAIVGFAYFLLALLWYLPFFAWVGTLSTIFGRWSIPLALLAPVVVSLFEGVFDFGRAPGGSYVLSFLRARSDLAFDSAGLRMAFLSPQPIDAARQIEFLIAGVDWPALGGGVVVAIVLIFAASEYRRRVLTP